MNCKVCKDEIIENEAGGKKFFYCRTCKDERTVWGYELPKLEDKPNDIKIEGQSKRKNQEADLYGTYGGGHNVRPYDPYLDPYYGGAGGTNPSDPQTLTQAEIDKMFSDAYGNGAD